MNKIIGVLFIMFAIHILEANSQIVRGGVEDEIYINTDWYYDGAFSHYGLFYSSNNGQNIEVMYEYTSPQQTNPPLGLIVDDAEPGILYNMPVYNSDFMISLDFGHSWEIIEITPSYGEMTSGSIPGEIFHYGFSSEGFLLRSSNYAQDFDTINSGVLYAFRVGVAPGVLYGRTSAPMYLTYISYDGGFTFVDSIILDNSLTGEYLKDIYRGANSGEVYLVSYWTPDNYKVFFSSDNGHSWEYRYTTQAIEEWSFIFTPGRENGSFYIARMTIDPTMTHTLLYIDYSSDSAKTFTTYFHDLSPDVGVNEKGKESDKAYLKCYPNPTDDLLHVSNLLDYNTNETNTFLEIYNVFGTKVDEIIIHPDKNDIRINTSTYPSGLYITILSIDNRRLSASKFIISR